MKIKKRSGKVVEFDRVHIEHAIEKAFTAVRGGFDPITISYLTNQVLKKLPKRDISVEGVQNVVVQVLHESGYNDVGTAYTIYRYQRELIRKANTTDDSILSLVRNENKEMAEENANKSTVLASTQRDYIAGIVSRDLTRRLMLPEKITKAHDEGILHFHDMDYFVEPIANCCLINIGDMLDNGLVMNDKLVETPKSFQVACTVTTQIIACVASNQYGGQSVDLSHLGKYLRRSKEKFLRKLNESCPELGEEEREKIAMMQTREELKAGVQTIQYQINTLMTTNGQSPFVTLFLYLREDDPYIEENAMIIEEVLKQRLEGIKNEAGVYITPAFPKLVYVLDENNCLKGGKYDYLTKLAVKCSAKRMYPDYISAKKMRENYQGNVFSPMGCRSFLAPWKDENGNYKFEGRLTAEVEPSLNSVNA